MIKKIILSMLVLSALLQADNIFSKLPYGIKIGEEIPNKILKMNIRNESYGSKELIYMIIEGKFMLVRSKDDYKVLKVVYNTNKNQTLPKSLRKAGLWICSGNYPGPLYEDVLQIIKKNDVSDLESNKAKGEISFKVDNDKQYEFVFYIYNSDQYCNKGGLYEISIHAIEEDEY